MNSIFTNELKNKLYTLGQSADNGRFSKYDKPYTPSDAIPESSFTPELVGQINSLLDKRITEVETGIAEPVSGINTELKESAVLKDAPTLLRYLDENRISFDGHRLVSKEDDTSEDIKNDYKNNAKSKYKKINMGALSYYILPEDITKYLRYTISKIENKTIASVFKVKVETIIRTINDITGSNISINKSQEELDLEKSIQESVDIPLHLYNFADQSKVKLHSNDLTSVESFVKFLKDKRVLSRQTPTEIDALFETVETAAKEHPEAYAFAPKAYVQKALEYIRLYLTLQYNSTLVSKAKETYKKLIALSGQLLGQLGSSGYTEKSTSPSEASAYTPDDQAKAKALIELRKLPFTSNSFLDIKQVEAFFKEITNFLTVTKRTTELNVVTNNYNSFNNRLTSLRNARLTGNTLTITNAENFLGLNNLSPNARVPAALNIFQLMVQDVVNTCDYIQTIEILKGEEYIHKLNSNTLLGEQLVRSISSSFNVAQARSL